MLSDSFSDLMLVRKSKTLIDCFDLIKDQSDDIKSLEAKCDSIRSNNAKKQAFKTLKFYLAYKKQKTINLKRA